MACRTLELTLVSARDLRAVNLVSKMEVYAVAYEAGDPRSRQRVPADRAGGRNPTWNATVLLTVPASAGTGSGAVRILLRTERALGGDRDVGEVFLPLADVLAGAGTGPRRTPRSPASLSAGSAAQASPRACSTSLTSSAGSSSRTTLPPGPREPRGCRQLAARV